MTTPGKQQSSAHESLVGHTLRKGEYTLHKIIGRGGMGSVYLASHIALTIPLAIKRMPADQALPEAVTYELDNLLHEHVMAYPTADRGRQNTVFPSSGGEHTDRFLREALLLARLHHIAIPSLYDYFLENGHWHLVMDYIPGQTLTRYLHQYAPLPPLEAINYTMQLCDVLHYLHAQMPPVIFRDLKPSNLLLTPDGTIMLVDFGIARYFKEGQVNDTTDFGSPGYASPEQYQSDSQTDARSDLFSLGIILHEMLTSERPNTLTNLRDVLDTVHQLVPSVSPALSGLVTLATRTEPSYRFQSARTFYLALERAYLIEEQRAYQHELQQQHAPEQNASQAGTVSTEATATLSPPAMQEQPLAPGEPPQPIPLLTMEQRQQIHEALQEARMERLEHERLEAQLASVDESLKMRATLPLSQVPMPFEETAPPSLQAQPVPRRQTRHVLKISFISAFLLCIIMASLLIYTRYIPHTPAATSGQSIPSTPTATPPFASSWQLLPSLPSPEADNTLVYIQVQGHSYIYMNGGYRGPKQTPPYDHTLYRYNIATAHWEHLAGAHFPGMVNNAVAQDGQGDIFFTVGYSTDSYTVSSLLYKYRPANDTLEQIVPPAQLQIGFGSSILADQHGHLYLTQGFMQSGNAHAKAGMGWYRFDIADGSWHQIEQLPMGLGYVTLTQAKDGSILMIGGAIDAGQRIQSGHIYRYDTTHNRWSQAPTSTPLPLSGSASCLIGPDKEVIIGGYDAQHDSILEQSWLVDLHTLTWNTLAPLPGGGSMLGAATCDSAGHVFLERGASDPSTPTADFLQLSMKI